MIELTFKRLTVSVVATVDEPLADHNSVDLTESFSVEWL